MFLSFIPSFRAYQNRKRICWGHRINEGRYVPSLMIHQPALISRHHTQLPEGPTDSDQYSKQFEARTFEIS